MSRVIGSPRAGLSVLTAMVFILLYGPLLVPIVSSFFEIARGDVQWTSPSLSAYAALTQNKAIITAFITEPHSLLMVVQPVAAGSPALSAA